MENILINPQNYESEYLNYLNECFPGWGPKEQFEWVFSGIAGGKDSDFIIIKNEDNEVIAGSGVTYRTIELANNKRLVDIAIMTGSWTLPQSRGRGIFTKIITISQEIAAKKGAVYLTGFAVESNVSFRRLTGAGSSLIITYHLFAPAANFNDCAEVKELEITTEQIADVYKEFVRTSNGFTKFKYTIEQFTYQYFERPKGPKLFKLNNEYAIVEETYNAFFVLLLTYTDLNAFEGIIKSLTNWANNNNVGKKLLLFTSRPEVNDICLKLNFENLSSYFTVLPTGFSTDLQIRDLEPIKFNGADKM
ncbi:MAG: hypothetical protein ACXWEY_00585 [Bacteroidia bacterium]